MGPRYSQRHDMQGRQGRRQEWVVLKSLKSSVQALRNGEANPRRVSSIAWSSRPAKHWSIIVEALHDRADDRAYNPVTWMRRYEVECRNKRVRKKHEGSFRTVVARQDEPTGIPACDCSKVDRLFDVNRQDPSGIVLAHITRHPFL